MKPMPILFSTPMVQAILNGTKTQTRRVVPQKMFDEYVEYCEYCVSMLTKCNIDQDQCMQEYFLECARYQVGDVLYIRETWMPETEQGIPTGGYIYKAVSQVYPDGDTPLRWRPSIHMPYVAARLFLRLTDVRVERLQDINEADAYLEGMDDQNGERVCHFERLWNKINGKRCGGSYAWEKNPWVWVYTFESFRRMNL